MSNGVGLERILIPLDGSEYGDRALPWAKALDGTDADVILLAVIPVAQEVRAFQGQVIGKAEDIQRTYQELATQQLEAARESWFGSREKVSVVVAVGDPSEQILATAEDRGASIIVMSSHGRGSLGRFVSGSVADRVVRHAPFRVMVVGPAGELEQEEHILRVVAPVEDSPLSLGALPVAAKVARQTGAPVHIVTVVAPAAEEMPLVPGELEPLPPNYYDDIHTERVGESKALVDRAVATVTDLGVEAHGEVYTGNVAGTILGSLQRGDVLVLASHGRGGLARWVVGSTALKMIQSGHAPVVVVTREYLERQ